MGFEKEKKKNFVGLCCDLVTDNFCGKKGDSERSNI